MYKGNFSNSFVKWAVIIFLFPIFFGGIILRLADRIIGKKKAEEVDLVAKLFDEIAPKYENRKGGYTRIIKIGLRKGDAAMEVLMELV